MLTELHMLTFHGLTCLIRDPVCLLLGSAVSILQRFQPQIKVVSGHCVTSDGPRDYMGKCDVDMRLCIS